MIVRGPERREKHAEKDDQIGPALTCIEKLIHGGFAGQKCQSAQPRQKNHDIGSDVAKVRNAEQTTLVRKVMVGRRQIHSRREQCRDSSGKR